jgi:hypothetical protein
MMLAVAVTAVTTVPWGQTAEAKQPDRDTIVVRVVDQFGDPLPAASVIACPLTGGQFDCAAPETGVDVNSGGTGRLLLAPASEYRLLAFVADPYPAWACPGLMIGENELYLAEESIEGRAEDFPKQVTFMVREPSALDCVVVGVTDDSGNPLPTAGLFVCAHDPGSSECIGDRFEEPDADGVIRMALDPDLIYDLGTFIANTGWPCPGFISQDGTEFHFGASGSFTMQELVAGVTLVIPVPDLSDCTPGTVTVTDDSGNLLTTAGLFVCAHTTGSTDCVGDRFDGADPDGIIRITVDPGLVYDLGAFIANPGWPCPGFFLDDGTVLYFGVNGTFTADQLLTGVVLTIHMPAPEDCVRLLVTDDSGNPLPTGAVSICAHLPGSADCIGSTFSGADPQSGLVTIMIDPALIYDLRPLARNTGWPCPSFIAPDGTTFHNGELVSFTVNDLLTLPTLIVPEPSPDDCP